MNLLQNYNNLANIQNKNNKNNTPNYKLRTRRQRRVCKNNSELLHKINHYFCMNPINRPKQT
jgi:hypothetical protein